MNTLRLRSGWRMGCWIWMMASMMASASSHEKQVIIGVKGMTCPLCVVAINHALRTTPRVIQAKASMKTHQVRVIVPQSFDDQGLLIAIRQAGYTGQILSDTPAH